MVEDDVFNDAVYYRRVASILINAGYSKVPSMETVLLLSVSTGNIQLIRWVNKHYNNTMQIFSGMTTLYMRRH